MIPLQDLLVDVPVGAGRIAFVLLLFLVARQLVRRTSPRVARVLVRTDMAEGQGRTDEEVTKRRETVQLVVRRTAEVLLATIALFTALSELGIDIAPVLAGAGVVGIAVGFGAQALVRDVLGGIFVIVEDQYGKGDVVRIADTAGMVEQVSLRRTILRDLDGIVHSVPNGLIGVSSNYTRGWSRVNLNVSVGYGEDLDRVRAVLDRVGAELAVDPAWSDRITEPPKVLRVDAFEESGVALKILATTRPLHQWDVAGELRRRIKIAFDAEGIEIPYPHRVLVMQPATPGADRPLVPFGPPARSDPVRGR